jgi:hypothetical protein
MVAIGALPRASVVIVMARWRASACLASATIRSCAITRGSGGGGGAARVGSGADAIPPRTSPVTSMVSLAVVSAAAPGRLSTTPSKVRPAIGTFWT